MMMREISLDLACDEDAPRRARQSIDGLAVGNNLREDARLLTSELVTNALLHSGCAPGETIGFQAMLTGDGSVMITVRDPGHSDGEARIEPQESPMGGLGLRLVDLLARRWGSDRADGHVVWAELA